MSRDRSLGLAWQPDAERYTLGRFLEDVASRHGGREALRAFDAQTDVWQSMSYEALRAEARKVAKGLIGAGVVKGARVALLMPNRPEWVVCAFAAGLVGAVLVPVNTFATPQELDYILRHGDASLLILQPSMSGHAFLSDLRERHPEIASAPKGAIRLPALPQLRRVVCLEESESLESLDGLIQLGEGVSDALLDAIGEEVTPADDAILIYTSGTTAHPKGVLHMHRAAVIQSWRFGEGMEIAPEERVLTAQPFFWTAGIAMSLGASLAGGATLVLEQRFDAERFLALIEEQGITTLHAWPHQEKAMAEHPAAKTRDLTSLRKVEFASPMAALAGIEKDEWGTSGSYGLSETFTICSFLPARTEATLRSGTSGRPLPGMRLKIVDSETGEDLTAPQSKGEIAVKGATFMRSYYKVEPEDYLDENGFFRTRDGGHFDAEGYLHWSGRLSNLIKTGGANVSPLEIQDACESHPAVRVAQALGIPHPVLGEAIVLCVVARADQPLDEAALGAHLRERLAAYKRPKVILFYGADELDYTATQKIQVAPLKEKTLARLASEGIEIDGVRY